MRIKSGKKLSWRKRKSSSMVEIMSQGVITVLTPLMKLLVKRTPMKKISWPRLTWTRVISWNETMRQIFTSHKPVVDTSVREASPMIAEPGVTPQADEEGDAEEPSQPDVGGSRADSTNAEDVQFADLDVVESPQLSYPVDLPQEPAPGASPDPQAVAAGEQDAAEALEPSDAPQVDTPSEEDDVMAVDPTLEVDKSVLVDPGSQQQQEPVDTVMESPEVTAASLPQTPKPLKPVTQHVTPRLPPPYLSVRPNDSVSVQESIEVAEDMPESALRTPMKIQDPIEVEDDEEAEKERSPSPVYSTPKAGVAKRMRNRFGQVPFPVPEDVEEQLLSSRAIPDVSIVPVLQVPVVEISVTRSLRRKTAAAAVSVASNQAEKPPAIQPKRRGRQPLSEEEKARRAAAKQAEKEEKARLKKEKQEQAQAAKEAQKAQKAAERKAKRATSKRVTKITVVPAQEHEEEPEPDVATAPEKDETIVPETPQPDNEQSLAQWATLEPLQSQPTFAPSEASIDQLYPSTPQPEPSSGGDIDGVEELVLDTTGESHDHRAVTESPPREVPDDAVRKEPLFLPSESQSQALLGHTQQDHAEVIPSSPPVVFGTEEEDQELALPVPVKKALPASQPAPQPSVAPYRRLTDIASSQGSLFSRPSGSLPPAIARKPHAQEDLSQLYPDDDDEDSDDDDDDSDEDGKEEKSHIPKNRRAGSGVGVSMRRTAGLLKFI
ncbi:hypothetical protein NEOLEDRAFT_76780 [Neolentinus lepideus HHB14362 ss-1]|uniref:Uncharacterized protein n=1 Tax=Neolentinus lepideus HHB14362 ss-1 TaxID=1314782 RepID=A0A165N1Y3_9AGAM|nr:hypothetical protein NEOLEDRAFT_76780 [Neolentinus lepideus HHB14362 ss-1]